MVKHISKTNWIVENSPSWNEVETYCGAKPKTVFNITQYPTSSTGVDCDKCLDLYWQEKPNDTPHLNPYFDAHNPEGNEKLRKIKQQKETSHE